MDNPSITYFCSISFIIADDVTSPLIELVTKNDDTYCSPAADGDGLILVKADASGSTNFYFKWYVGSDTAAVNAELTDASEFASQT